MPTTWWSMSSGSWAQKVPPPLKSAIYVVTERRKAVNIDINFYLAHNKYLNWDAILSTMIQKHEHSETIRKSQIQWFFFLLICWLGHDDSFLSTRTVIETSCLANGFILKAIENMWQRQIECPSNYVLRLKVDLFTSILLFKRRQIKFQKVSDKCSTIVIIRRSN